VRLSGTGPSSMKFSGRRSCSWQSSGQSIPTSVPAVLLTGSANLMTLPQVADSLAGRIEITGLPPLSQSELRNKPCDFFERVMNGKAPSIGEIVVGEELTECVLAGGYPEALKRSSWGRRQKWFLDFIRAVIERDVRDISHIEYTRQMPKLLRVLAAHSAQRVNYSSIGAPLGIGHATAQKYTDILRHLFLVRTLQPWYTSEPHSVRSWRHSFSPSCSSSPAGTLIGSSSSIYATTTTTKSTSSSRTRAAT
jgi:predicted AAA+ superfamily ATPase